MRFAAGASLRPRANHPAGFTLLEVLLAISVGAMLMVAVVTLAYSMSDLWGASSEPRLFAQHVRGVSRFLENLLRQAEPPPEITSTVADARSAQQQQQQQQQGQQPGETPLQPGQQPGQSPGVGQAGANGTANARTDLPPVAWQQPRGRKYGTEEFLTFELPESPGIFAWPDQPLPFVVCSLRVDPDDGLFLLWKSRLEEDFEEEAPREFRVSPYVTGITYDYYDTSGPRPKWEQTTQPQSAGGEREIPARIELTFEYQGQKIVTTLVIPSAASTVPIY